MYASSLTSINFSDSLTSIGSSAFVGCTSVTSINFPDSFTSIEGGAFQDCSSLTSIDLPDSLTSIGDYAFSLCKSLTSIKLPGGVTSIGRGAFRDCSSLTSINLPASLTEIGESAFKGCAALTATVVKGSYAEKYCKDNKVPYKYGTDPGPGSSSDVTVTCDPTAVTLSQKETLTIKASTTGLSKKEKYTFKSSNEKVAAVAKTTGKITAKNPGTTIITVTGKTSKKTATCEVTVIPAPEKMILVKPSITDYTTESEPFQLTASIEPNNADQTIKWTSSDESVARVDSSGLVTPVGQGSATITATAAKKNIKKKPVKETFKLTVTDLHMPASITIGGEATQYVDLNGTLQLTYSLEAAMEGQTAESDATWSIPKKQEKYATINSKTGMLTASDKEGSVTVTVTTVKKGGTGKKLK